jgi:protein gp37
MGEHTGIEWTDSTFNAWWGCVKVSQGCAHCYAETLDARFHAGDKHWGPNSPRKLFGDKHWKQLDAWNSQAKKEGKPRKVFVGSMMDIWEPHPDVVPARARLIAGIDTGKWPWLIFQMLSKRIENCKDFVPTRWLQKGFPANVWIGVTIEDDANLDARMYELLALPAAVRFVSYEPVLGQLARMGAYIADHTHNIVQADTETAQRLRGVQWVICGGESGNNARLMKPEWAEQMQQICQRAGVPFFFKQWGTIEPLDFVTPDEMFAYTNAGWDKDAKKGGSTLYGKQYKEFPPIKNPE